MRNDESASLPSVPSFAMWGLPFHHGHNVVAARKHSDRYHRMHGPILGAHVPTYGSGWKWHNVCARLR